MMHYEVPNERLRGFVQEIKLYFNQEQNRTLYDKRNVIKVVPFEGKLYVVKSFRIPHLFNQIVYRFFRPSKARRSFENSIRLCQLQLHTPEPIGYIEFFSPWRFQESFYISAFFDYDFEIRAVFKDKMFPEREAILEAFIAYTYRLHEKGVYHIDYSPGNILVKKEGSRYIFSIIDVNRMKFLPLDMALRMQSLAKLTNDAEDNALMVRYYAKEASQERALLQNLLQEALEKQENYLKRKKRLKKIKV